MDAPDAPDAPPSERCAGFSGCGAAVSELAPKMDEKTSALAAAWRRFLVPPAAGAAGALGAPMTAGRPGAGAATGAAAGTAAPCTDGACELGGGGATPTSESSESDIVEHPAPPRRAWGERLASAFRFF